MGKEMDKMEGKKMNEKEEIERIEALQILGGRGVKRGGSLRVSKPSSGLFLLRKYRKGNLQTLCQRSFVVILDYVADGKKKGLWR